MGNESRSSPPTAVTETTHAPEAAAVGGAVRKRSRREFATAILGRYGVVIAFLLVVLFFSLAKPDIFPTSTNAKAILTDAAPSMIVAVGLTVVLAMQDFDLSFGSMIGLAGGVAVALMTRHDVGWVVALLAALGFGLTVGILNGYLIAFLGGSSFIITLAMGTVLTGLEYAFTKQATVFSGVPQGYVNLASEDYILGLSNQVWIAVAVALILWALLDRTEIGRYMYAIGGNPEAARLSGIRTRALRVLGFVIVGITAALVGIILTSQGGSYTPNPGASYLLPAYAAAFLGAASFRPGEFNVPGTVIGVLFLGTISTGLTQLNLETYLINLVQGGILILAVILGRLGQRTAA